MRFFRKNISDAGLNVSSIKGQANPSKKHFFLISLEPVMVHFKGLGITVKNFEILISVFGIKNLLYPALYDSVIYYECIFFFEYLE